MLQGEHSAILSTFIKLPFVIKIFVLSISEWPLYTGFTVVNQYFLLLSLKTYESSLMVLEMSLSFVLFSVAVNRVATYRELDNDLLKQAAFLTLVSMNITLDLRGLLLDTNHRWHFSSLELGK